MSIRTDLAIENQEMLNKQKLSETDYDGILSNVEKDDGITITNIKITNKAGEEKIGKPIGNYITIESPNIKYSADEYKKTCVKISETIDNLLTKRSDNPILVVGLGNREITPDALGPAVVSKLIVTRHMKEYAEDFNDYSNVCAIAPGVLATTGIESVSIIKGITDKINPAGIIVIDALAARNINRISTTIQICDTGIRPGSGVGNRRDVLNEFTLGTKVIAIGVPTVIDASTIVQDSIDSFLSKSNTTEYDDKTIQSISENTEKFVVTPNDIDFVIERCAKTIANGINMALHKNLSFDDIENFVG